MNGHYRPDMQVCEIALMHANKITVDLWPYSYTDTQKYKINQHRKQLHRSGWMTLHPPRLQDSGNIMAATMKG